LAYVWHDHTWDWSTDQRPHNRARARSDVECSVKFDSLEFRASRVG